MYSFIRLFLYQAEWREAAGGEAKAVASEVEPQQAQRGAQPAVPRPARQRGAAKKQEKEEEEEEEEGDEDEAARQRFLRARGMIGEGLEFRGPAKCIGAWPTNQTKTTTRLRC